MDLQKIEILIEKYLEGNSTIQEERELKKLFMEGKMPPKYDKLAPLFGFLHQESTLKLEDVDFEERLMASLEAKEQTRTISIKRRNFYRVSAIAAGLLILLAFALQFIFNSTRMDTNYGTYQDPGQAYEETKRILAQVSVNMNKGTDELGTLGMIENGMEKLQPVSKLSTGLQSMEKIYKFHETRKEITNKKEKL